MPDMIQKWEYRTKAIKETQNAILPDAWSSARRILNSLVDKGYLTVDRAQIPHIYHLQQHT